MQTYKSVTGCVYVWVLITFLPLVSAVDSVGSFQPELENGISPLRAMLMVDLISVGPPISHFTEKKADRRDPTVCSSSYIQHESPHTVSIL